MDWWQILILVFGMLVVLMFCGMPIAIAFLLVDILGAVVFLGGEAGLIQLILNIEDCLTSFSLLPVPLFIFMGELMFHSNMGVQAIDVFEKWLGKIPGRLGLLAITTGTLFSTMSGSTMATTAMLGTLLVPEMKKRGYSKTMSIGPIIGSGGLSMLIPPSALAILLAALSNISVGKLLIAGIIPGFLIAFFYSIYVVTRCWIEPSLAPPYDTPPLPVSVKLMETVRYVLPLGLIIFLVIGVIFLGVATPSEAAALGALGSLFLAGLYGQLNWSVLKKSLQGTMRISGMMFIIILGSMTFSQILAFSGASGGLVQSVLNVDVPPFLILLSMQVTLLFLGCFMDNLSMVMVALPIYLPFIHALGFNPLWFSLLMLLNMEMANTTPPFGLLLFVMKGVSPPDTTMVDIYKAGFPFLVCDAVAMGLIIIFPAIALYLPNLMH
jgi:tripartite ATP-independent transporter DctM subunit